MARFLRLLALFLALTVAVLADSDEQCVGGEGECAADEPVQTMTETEEDPKCPSRRHIIQCAGQYLDTNNNGKLDRSELQAAIDSLPWYGRGIIQLLGSVDKMMKKCDIDGDDAISMDYDIQNNGETCLATCFKRAAFKRSFFPDCSA